MSITVSFTGDDAASIDAQIAAYLGATPEATAAPATSKPAAEKPAKPAKPAKEPEAPAGPTVEEIRAIIDKFDKEALDGPQGIIKEAYATAKSSDKPSVSGLAKLSAEIRQGVVDGLNKLLEAADSVSMD